MSTLTIIFLSCFVLYTIVHLIFCFAEKEDYRKKSKPFCLLFLVAASITEAIVSKNYYLFIVAAGSLLGSIGDIFLIWKRNKKLFVFGTLSFIAGHFCYLGYLLFALSNENITVPLPATIIIAVVLVILVIGLYPFTRKLAGRAALLGNFYMPFLVVMEAASIFALVSLNGYWPMILMSVGYILFLSSDTFLIYTTFIKDKKRRDFWIMLTYLLAELLIVLSLLLLI